MKRRSRTQAQGYRAGVARVSQWYAGHGRIWLRNIAVTLFALAIVVPAAGFLKQRLSPENMPIRNIEIRGDLARVDVKAVEALVGPLVAGGVMRADVYDVARLVEHQPWVARCWVRKRWPETLEIQIAAHKPIARWGKRQWLDENAMVFTGSEQPDSAAFDVLYGPTGYEQRLLDAYLADARALKRVGLDLKRLSVDERRAWRIEAVVPGERQALLIELGREDIARRFARFVAIYANRDLAADAPGEGARLTRVDMRYPHGLAVTWSEQRPDIEHAQGVSEGGQG